MKLSTSSDALISTCGSQSADISDTMPLKRVRRHNVRSDGFLEDKIRVVIYVGDDFQLRASWRRF
ncbi:unnamed protein product [Clonostachys chloroleuca]|uniref:Uncharacterized protein n=1 Tax=Clonostachys chloroleuca TaxID=1926264 RepID=A0AA35LSV4_9HYPO|nr:unnamed protein product [Clonostachys chloroleuca]